MPNCFRAARQVAPGVLIETESEKPTIVSVESGGSLEAIRFRFEIQFQHLVITIEAPASAQIACSGSRSSNVTERRSTRPLCRK